MKILVFGCGAVGSMMGAFLSRSGHEVSLLGRKGHMQAIGAKGLHVKGIWGEFCVKDFSLYEDVSDIPESCAFDVILLTVKSFDTAKAVQSLLPFVRKKTTLISFQNGLGNIESITEQIPAEQFLVGRIITGVERMDGLVEITVSADALAIGELPQVRTNWSAEEAALIFTQSKIMARSVPNILTYIWSKVIYNCALNGPCSVLEIPYGEILKDKANRDSLRKIVNECYAVGLAKGILLEPRDAREYEDLLVHTLIPKTASHYPSMLRDIQNDRRTEIDALNGAIALLGRGFDIPTPENQRITDLIRKKSVRV